MKKSLFVTMVIAILVVSMITGYAANPISVYVDMKPIAFDVQPYKDQNNSVLAPARFIANELGAQVAWDSETQTVTITKGTDTISLVVGSNTAYLNGSEIPLVAPAVIYNGRVCVPVRFVAELLGADVTWDYAHNRVYIKTDLSKKLVVNGKEIIGMENADIIPYYNQVDKVFKASGYQYTQFFDEGSTVSLNLFKEGTDETDYHNIDMYFSAESGSDFKSRPYTIAFSNSKPLTDNAKILMKNILKVFYPTGYETVYDEMMNIVNDDSYGDIAKTGFRYKSGTVDGRTYYVTNASIMYGIDIGGDN